MAIGRSVGRQSGLTRGHERPQLCSISLAEPIWAGGHDAASTEAGHMTAIEPAPSLHLALLNPAGRPHMDKWPAGARLSAVAPAGHLPTAPTPLGGARSHPHARPARVPQSQNLSYFPHRQSLGWHRVPPARRTTLPVIGSPASAQDAPPQGCPGSIGITVRLPSESAAILNPWFSDVFCWSAPLFGLFSQRFRAFPPSGWPDGGVGD